MIRRGLRSSRARPIIFLNIDGVLAQLHIGYRYGVLDTCCVDALNKLLDASNAVIVVSSSWRYVENWFRLVSVLESQGVRADRIVSRTPIPERQEMGIVLSPCRGDEIQAWLSIHADSDTRFVILDDEGDMGPLVDRLIRTNHEDGLTQSDVTRALRLLEVD